MPVDSQNGPANSPEERSGFQGREFLRQLKWKPYHSHSLELPDSFSALLAPLEGLTLKYCHGIIIHVTVLWSVFV